MKIISKKRKLEEVLKGYRNLGFVPTMGGLHTGHISLIKKSIIQCEKTIVSIFINKPQFNQKKDYMKYPRVIKKDIKKLENLRVDFLYLPRHKEIYPKGINKSIKINPFGRQLCGKKRPGHFEAVADVIDRFIKIIKPKKIYFGEKDMQQLKIMDEFIKKNHPYTKVIPCRTIREKNGIAMSSRNYLLSFNEKIIASKIFKLLISKKQSLIKDKISLIKLKDKIIKLGAKKIDYINIIDINKIIKPYKKKKIFKIFIAYYLGSVRLIDNI